MMANAILAAHAAIIFFNVFGLVAVPIGAACGWQFVRIRWWRILHILLLAAVAAQAVFGRACILTLWQAALAGAAADRTPLIARWVDRIIYWPLPIWVFAVLYVVIFGYALALLWLVPPRPPPGPRAKAVG
jgi:polyferredoxin